MIFMFLLRIIFFIILCINISIAAPFQNGSFEQDSSKWQDNNGSGSWDTDFLGASEQDLTGWTLVVPSQEINWITVGPGGLSGGQDGTYCLLLGLSTEQGQKAQQAFDTVSGKTYTVSYYVRAWDTSISTTARRTVTMTIRDSNTSGTVLQTHSGIATVDSVWQQKTFTFTATSSTSHITVAQLSGSARVYVDNIAIAENSSPPVITNSNSAIYPDDPSSTNLKAIPGQVMVFDNGIQNTGGEADANSTQIYVSIPTQIDFEQNSIVFQDARQAIAGATGNVATNYTTITTSGLSCSTCWEYSINTGQGGPWTSLPNTMSSYVINSQTYLPNVKGIRLNLTGTFADGSSSATGFRFYYKGIIK